MVNSLSQIPWKEDLIRILIYFAAAWVVASILNLVVRRVFRTRRLPAALDDHKQQRQRTLQGLVTSSISLLAFLIAFMASLALFIRLDTLAWMVGLFSAAFGFGARPMISDFLAGLGFIFEDTYSVGEKIEIAQLHVTIEGVVENISLRTTLVRSSSGELYVVPNGEIRIVRNFSRGKFSIANITLKISAPDLGKTISILEEMAAEAVTLLPNLIEPWQVISEEGLIGQSTQLTIVAKARFGMAAEMRPRLLELVRQRLADADVELAE